MKYIILIGDGMADEPLHECGGKTPLEYAATPNMDRMAGAGRFGLFKTIPDGFPPGSDVAALSIFGYPPQRYYTGRAPLEAASLGVRLGEDDVAFRCNLVTLKEDGRTLMEDYSAGHISTEEAAAIVETLNERLSYLGVTFHTGKSYRHLMVWHNGVDDIKTTPPHDIMGQPVEEHLPGGNGAERLRELMELSREVLKDHPANVARRKEGRPTADAIWLWGGGRSPSLPTFHESFGMEGAVISAVDLVNGIGVLAGLEVIRVPGATGYIDTNYEGKADYALRALLTKDFVCVHVEAPDEAGHEGSLVKKLRAIEDFDRKVVGRILEGLEAFDTVRVAVLADHPTPVRLRTHTPDPVPFAICTGTPDVGNNKVGFCEKDAQKNRVFIESPEDFIGEFLGRRAT